MSRKVFHESSSRHHTPKEHRVPFHRGADHPGDCDPRFHRLLPLRWTKDWPLLADEWFQSLFPVHERAFYQEPYVSTFDSRSAPWKCTPRIVFYDKTQTLPPSAPQFPHSSINPFRSSYTRTQQGSPPYLQFLIRRKQYHSWNFLSMHQPKFCSNVKNLKAENTLEPIHSINFPTVIREGYPCGFIITSGHIPASLKGMFSWGTIRPVTPFWPCLDENLSPSSGRRVWCQATLTRRHWASSVIMT